MLSVGDTAPDFSLPNQDNQPISLHDYLGQWVVLYFYPKDDTPGCTEEACQFRDSLEALTNEGVVVLGVSKDTVKSHQKFHAKYNLNFSILADPTHEVIEHYGAWQQKSMFGKTYLGTQRMTYIIAPNGTIAHIFPKVSPRGHEKEVLTVIKDLSNKGQNPTN